jgi:alginate O-acetyltransferase complex protein AlgI
MAIGLGGMMGFRFPENFRAPYLSASITEFWRRWHISLSTWLRDYLYIPLGGNRRGPARTILNLMLVMVLGGLWHGAAWTFILWGAWQGLFLALERGRRRARQEAGAAQEARRPLAVAATMLVVIVGWVLFRSATLREALSLYAGMIGLHGLGLSAALGWQIGGLELAVLALACFSVYAGPWLARRFAPASGAPGLEGSVADPLAGRLAVVPLFALALLRTAAESFSPFLYFQF